MRICHSNPHYVTAGKKKRNFILDQTNVYASARKRKMKNFSGFYTKAAVLVTDDPELQRRSHKRTYEDGRYCVIMCLLTTGHYYSITGIFHRHLFFDFFALLMPK